MSPGTVAFCLLWGEYRVPWILAFFWWLFCLREGRAWFQQSLSSDSLMLLNLSASLLNSDTGWTRVVCLVMSHMAVVSTTMQHWWQALPHPQPDIWIGALFVLSHPFWWVQRAMGLCFILRGCLILSELLLRGWWPLKGAHLLGRVTAPFLRPGHTSYLVILPGLGLLGTFVSLATLRSL